MVKVPLDQGSFCQGSFGPRFLWTEVPLVKVPLGQGSFAKVPLDQVPLVKVPLGLHLPRLHKFSYSDRSKIKIKNNSAITQSECLDFEK